MTHIIIISDGKQITYCLPEPLTPIEIIKSLQVLELAFTIGLYSAIIALEQERDYNPLTPEVTNINEYRTHELSY